MKSAACCTVSAAIWPWPARCLDLGFYHLLPRHPHLPGQRSGARGRRGRADRRLLVETDCPYLAPQPWRGKRNEPAYVRHTAEALAAIKGLTLADVARITSLNALRLFGIGEVEQDARIAYAIRNSLYLNITNRCTNQLHLLREIQRLHRQGPPALPGARAGRQPR